MFLIAPIYLPQNSFSFSSNLYYSINWGQEQLFLLPWYLKCAGQSEIKLALTDAGKVETKLFYV